MGLIELIVGLIGGLRNGVTINKKVGFSVVYKVEKEKTDDVIGEDRSEGNERPDLEYHVMKLKNESLVN